MNRTLLSLNLGSNLIGDKGTLKIAEVNNSNFVLLPFILCVFVVILLLSDKGTIKIAEANVSNLVPSPFVLSLLIAVLLLPDKGTLRIAEANDSNRVLSPCVLIIFIVIILLSDKGKYGIRQVKVISLYHHPFQYFAYLLRYVLKFSVCWYTIIKFRLSKIKPIIF